MNGCTLRFENAVWFFLNVSCVLFEIAPSTGSQMFFVNNMYPLTAMCTVSRSVCVIRSRSATALRLQKLA